MKYILICLIVTLSFECGRCANDGAPQNDATVKKNEKDVDVTRQENSGHTTGKPNDNVPSNTFPNTNNGTKINTTELQKGDENLYEKVVKNKAMLMRTFYVLLGVTSIVVIYFVIRAWRSKRRYNKSRKYGLITTSGADLEMEPLDQDVDEDDEMTMFERRK